MKRGQSDFLPILTLGLSGLVLGLMKRMLEHVLGEPITFVGGIVVLQACCVLLVARAFPRLHVVQIGAVAGAAAWFLATYAQTTPASRERTMYPLVLLPLGFILCFHLFVAYAGVSSRLHSLEPKSGHCRCGYDLAGNVSGRCPECGEPIGASR